MHSWATRTRRRPGWKTIFRGRSSAKVSVLNTGHIGYSLEQYDQTLRALGDRFRPHYVVISVCQNDFGDLNDPASWSEGEYWLDQIVELCRHREWQFLFVPLADEFAILGPRNLETDSRVIPPDLQVRRRELR